MPSDRPIARAALAGFQTTRPGYYGPIDTPNGFKARDEALLVCCPSGPGRPCGRNVEMDMDAMIAQGWGDVPVRVILERMRCSACGRRSPGMSRNGRSKTEDAGRGGYQSFGRSRTRPLAPGEGV